LHPLSIRKQMKANIVGILLTLSKNYTPRNDGFTRAEFDRINWNTIRVTLEDFRTEVGRITAAHVDEQNRVVVQAHVDVAENFQFNGLGIHWVAEQHAIQDTRKVVGVALCDPSIPEARILSVQRFPNNA